MVYWLVKIQRIPRRQADDNSGLRLSVTLSDRFADWESYAHHKAFIESHEHGSFIESLKQVFDFKVTAPLTRMLPPHVLLICRSEYAEAKLVYIRVSDIEGATAAFRSGVTELAFYTLPTRPNEEMESVVEHGSVVMLRDVQTVGKAMGASLGWGELSVPLSRLFHSEI